MHFEDRTAAATAITNVLGPHIDSITAARVASQILAALEPLVIPRVEHPADLKHDTVEIDQFTLARINLAVAWLTGFYAGRHPKDLPPSVDQGLRLLAQATAKFEEYAHD